MNTEQEALRLADLLQDEAGVDGYVHDEAAATLRKLVAEREEYRAAMRRALEALEEITRHFGFARLGESRFADTKVRGDAHAVITHLRQRLEGTT